ncbi:MAG: 2-hydroxyacid dehydrogenase [Lachnospiraceae bacterium]|nr:2-hydroxyacid dehydrogenase [Lachnospiraceae bacterium]MBQ4069654.1 2-hydroxyacid dehydrogenase [Lachnospiraceae bacterium]
MKIAFFGTKPYDKIWFESKSKDYEVDISFFEASLNIDTAPLAAGHEGVCAFVNDDVSEPVVDKLAELGVKMILMRCAGYNNVDIKAAERHNIPVMRVPSYSPQAVAEFAMALLLSVNRKTYKAYVRTRDFNMNINGLMGHDLYGKTAGVIGTGKIGQAMISILKGFGMKILAYDKYPNKDLDVEYVELDRLFSESDIISLHCPLTHETKYIIDRKSLDIMKKGVYIINTSRGQLIRTEDLLEALLANKIGGVGLDVYEEEDGVFYEDNSNEIMQDEILARLVSLPNVLVTSHQGYFTEEAMKAIAITTLENVKMYEEGKELVNQVK